MKTSILKRLHFLFLSIFLLILVLSSCNTSPSTQQIMDDMPALLVVLQETLPKYPLE